MAQFLAGPWHRVERGGVLRLTSPEQPSHAFAIIYMKTGGRGGKPCAKMRATALAMADAPALMASLRAILPYAESRAEEMLNSVGEGGDAPSQDEADEAWDAVAAAKALLASLDGDAPAAPVAAVPAPPCDFEARTVSGLAIFQPISSAARQWCVDCDGFTVAFQTIIANAESREAVAFRIEAEGFTVREL